MNLERAAGALNARSALITDNNIPMSMILNAILLALIATIFYGIYRIPPVKRRAKRFYFKHHKILIDRSRPALAILVAVVIGYVAGKKL